jgi:ATP-dependent DNA ligase
MINPEGRSLSMEQEIARVNRVAITMQKEIDGERKFALRYFVKPDDKEGVLAIQRLLTEKLFREMAAAFQQAVEYLDQS